MLEFLKIVINSPVTLKCNITFGDCGICYNAKIVSGSDCIFAYECSCGKFNIGTSNVQHHVYYRSIVTDKTFVIDDVQSGGEQLPKPKFIHDLCLFALRAGMVGIVDSDSSFLKQHLEYNYRHFIMRSFTLCNNVTISLDTDTIEIVFGKTVFHKFDYTGSIKTLFTKMIDTLVKTVVDELTNGSDELPQSVELYTRAIGALRMLEKKANLT